MDGTLINTAVTIISIIVGIVGIASAIKTAYKNKDATTAQSLMKFGRNAHIDNLIIINTEGKQYIAPVVKEKNSGPQTNITNDSNIQNIKAALKFENSIAIYQTEDNSFRFRITARNKEILVVSESYQTMADCRKAVIKFVEEIGKLPHN